MEIRFIVFSVDEARVAALSYLKKQGHQISATDIATLEFTGEKDTPTAAIQLLSCSAAKVIDTSTIRLDQQHLTAALILQCAERRIPLPRAGEKKVELSVNGLTLISTMDRGLGLPSVSSSQVSYGELANRATDTISKVQEQLARALARAEHAESLVARAEERARRAEAARGKSSASLIAIAMMPGIRGRLGRWLLKFRFPLADGII